MFEASIFKKILLNGLTILVVPRHDIPKVSAQLWYNVGSKDEASAEKGIAHFIEHMLFKGTKNMSESDINVASHKLSAECNACTSHDYTAYTFNIPSQHWYEVLPIMADCMTNCTFKPQQLNSELKAVVQEIKMYNDDYLHDLIEKMMSAIFHDHPYHHPVIGYKQDLWNLTSENLHNFYHKHYGPNNATLVIVGDVDPEDVFKRVEEHFGAIPKLEGYAKREFYHSPDIASQNIVIHRDVQQPLALFAWEIPGIKAKKDYVFDLISWIIGAGRGAVLYNKLVTELGIATELQSFVYDFFDHGLFMIYVQPNTLSDLPKIKQIIIETIEHYRNNFVTDAELDRARRKTEMDFLRLSESNQKQVNLIARTFLATGDEQYIKHYCDYPEERLKSDIQALFKRYFGHSLMHSGQVLKIDKQDQGLWHEMQKISDQEDARILGNILRDAVVEEPLYATTIVAQKPRNFKFPHPKKLMLSNGLTVLYYHKPGSGKLDFVLDLKAKHFYDPADKQGLSMMMTDLLQEGTKKRTAQEFALELESYGMDLNTFPGQMSMTMLSSDARKGLELFTEVLTEPAFDPQEVERIRNQVLAEIQMFWDEPRQFAGQLIRELVYKNHPYSKNIMGVEKAVRSITRDEILDAHKRYISPQGARLALVGDLGEYDIKELLESTLGQWQGPEVPDLDFPEVATVEGATVNRAMNRDQIVLSYGGVSVDRFNPDYDKLLLFDQVFTGGDLGSMSSRLFALRERTGLFYSIGGSLLAGVTREPGMVFIRTIVSPDCLEQAEEVIEGAIKEGAATLTQQELEEAQQALINSMVDNFASNKSIASTFIILDKYDFPENYFDVRIEELCAVTLEDIKQTVSKYLDINKLVKLRVGRI